MTRPLNFAGVFPVIPQDRHRLVHLFVVSPEAFFIFQGRRAIVAEKAAQIESGSPVEIVLGNACPRILLQEFVRVSAYEDDSTLHVKSDGLPIPGKYRYNEWAFSLTNPKQRNEAFDALRFVLGDAFEHKRIVFGMFRASLLPFGIIAFLIFEIAVTLVIALDRGPRDLGESTGIKVYRAIVFAMVDAIGLLGLGLLLGGSLLIGLFFTGKFLRHRLKNPPILLTLDRRRK